MSSGNVLWDDNEILNILYLISKLTVQGMIFSDVIEI